jgi:hypothetical protein
MPCVLLMCLTGSRRFLVGGIVSKRTPRE